MANLQPYQVYPEVPKALRFVVKMVRNLWWVWHRDAEDLFRRVNPTLWHDVGHNPILFSMLKSQERLQELALDESVISHLERVEALFKKDLLPVDRSDSPYGKENAIAYFSMEFGIHESIPLFAGGLGILAGDHLKACSDLALPLVGVGLLYRSGYFHQYLDQSGWQQEAYPETDLNTMPLFRTKDHLDQDVFVNVLGPFGEIRAAVWELKIGRITLFLLDTNLMENNQQIRDITARLYVGDHDLRLAQELLLGIGGMRALATIGIKPSICHMNEGHCTFAGIERLAQMMADYHVDLATAKEIVARTSVFTTHTPVSAGHDEFSSAAVKQVLQPFEHQLGVSVDEIISWGQQADKGGDSPFCMFVLGVRFAQYCNGVSKLHGKVARRMWQHLWPELDEVEAPITHVTNGVHIPSWISIENALLFERYLSPEWYLTTQTPAVVDRIDDIFDEELWRAHEISRSHLIRHCRKQLVKQYTRLNAPRSTMRDVEGVFDQDILTIAFARRFATYKRASLLLMDPQRLEALITSKEHPVQFVFAGKAHPKDDAGKELIQSIVDFSRKANVCHRFAFVEDYDINNARYLAHGADIWLNTPRRPYEACGTSGMKAAVNGVLNVSILDGWWCEGYHQDTGWSIGGEEEFADPGYQDAVESQALYNILENDIIPCFYDRPNGSVPVRWIKKMKASMKMAMQGFCSLRMVNEYENRFYLPIATRFSELVANNAEEAKQLMQQRQRLMSLWHGIHVEKPHREVNGPFRVEQAFMVTVVVKLGELTPDDVKVQVYCGYMRSIDRLTDSWSEVMTVKEALDNGVYSYFCKITCEKAGSFGFTARVIPNGDDWMQFAPGLISWA